MNKKCFKKSMLAVMLVSTIGIPLSTAPNIALAQEHTLTNVNNDATVGITDVQSELNKIGNYYYINNFADQTIKKDGIGYHLSKNPDSVETNLNLSITGAVSNLNYDSVTPVYIGNNEFDNTTDQTQKFTTTKFTKSVTESVTSTVTNGFKLGNPGVSLFTIPLILSDGLKINAEFNSATSESKQKSETKTIEASAQTIEVPAHKKYKVDVVLEQKKYWGDVTFKGEGANPQITVNATGVYTGWMGMQSKEKFSWSSNTIDLFNGLYGDQKNDIHGINFSDGKINVTGTGKVEGVFGSNLVVHVYDVTNQLKPVLVTSKSLK